MLLATSCLCLFLAGRPTALLRVFCLFPSGFRTVTLLLAALGESALLSLGSYDINGRSSLHVAGTGGVRQSAHNVTQCSVQCIGHVVLGIGTRPS